MTYGTRQLKNGKRVGYLHFDTGKQVYLNHKERAELDSKLNFAEQTGREKERAIK